MAYVSKVLQPNEKVVYTAKTHWAVYLPGVTYALMGTGLFWLGTEWKGWGDAAILGFFCVAAAFTLWPFGALSLLNAWVKRFATELVITDQRVISKFGLIRRSTAEIHRAKIQGVAIEQSIAGRILGYGTLVVTGTGGGWAPIPQIDNPLEFRNNVPIS